MNDEPFDGAPFDFAQDQSTGQAADGEDSPHSMVLSPARNPDKNDFKLDAIALGR